MLVDLQIRLQLRDGNIVPCCEPFDERFRRLLRMGGSVQLGAVTRRENQAFWRNAMRRLQCMWQAVG